VFDIRSAAAKYYDANPRNPDDIPFYRSRIRGPQSSVLELGCGTGRVLLPLARECAYIHGLDSSEAMLALCREKLRAAAIGPARAAVESADISAFSLGRRFDLVIAPFRVLQNVETDAQIDGVFDSVRAHLAPGGRCILNVFRPFRDAEGMRTQWIAGEALQWKTEFGRGKLLCYDRRPRMDAERRILYPELIYRYYEGERLVDEAVLKITMRYWYPDEFRDLFRRHGLRITGEWGGYGGETYGEGPELVLEAQ
jgi:SAM-dependent methyltransferase